MTDDDIAQLEALEADQAAMLPEIERKKRDVLLSETDWWVTKSVETGSPMTEEQLAYRQALRDVPEQSGFPNEIDWPVKPE